jgi:hypothetical protein
MSTPAEPPTWVTLINHRNYEISTIYPHQIRNNSTHKVISPFLRNGYLSVTLTDTRFFVQSEREVVHANIARNYYLHVLIAKQFIPNPEHLLQIDHIDRDRLNNDILNLRWVTRRQNSLNKSSHMGIIYEFVDSLPVDALQVTHYANYTFENLYYANETFYFFNGIHYRILYMIRRRGSFFVQTRDIYDNKRVIYLAKFRREYDI